MEDLLAALPYALLLLLCPLMMLFTHRGHGAHGDHDAHHLDATPSARPTKDQAEK